MRLGPLCCPNRGGEIKVISFITDQEVMRQILKHLGLSPPDPSRGHPATEPSRKNPVLESLDRGNELVYEFFDDMSTFNIPADGWPGYDESCIA